MDLMGKDRNSLGLNAGMPSVSAEQVFDISMAEMVTEKEANEMSERRNMGYRTLDGQEAKYMMHHHASCFPLSLGPKSRGI